MIAIYVRQSVDKKDSLSIEDQIERCKAEIGQESYKVYEDKGYSGKSLNRRDFPLMMNDIRAGNISKVVVYRLDRISRSVLDFANIYAVLEEYGVEFVSCNEKFQISVRQNHRANVTTVHNYILRFCKISLHIKQKFTHLRDCRNCRRHK